MNRSIALSLITLLSIACSTTAPAIAQTKAPAIEQTQSEQEIDMAYSEGMRLFQEGSAESLRKAIVQFEKALEMARSAKLTDRQGSSLLGLGRTHSALDEKQKAIEYYNQALPIIRELKDHSSEAIILNSIGVIYYLQGENQKAIEYYNEALPIFRAVNQRSNEATTLNNLALVHDSLGDKQKAIEYYNQALPIFREVSNRKGEAAIWNHLGSLYSSLGEKQKAIEHYNQAVPIFREMNDRPGEARAFNHLGLLYDLSGDKQTAVKCYNQALKIFREVGGNRSDEATTLINLGFVYYSLGKKQKAIEHYNQALPIFREMNDRSGEATTLNNLGLVSSSLDEKQKAIEYYSQALPIRHAVGDPSGEAATLHNLGILLEAQKQFELAIIFYKQSVNQYEIIRQNIRSLPKETQETYTQQVAATYRNLADLLLKADRILEAQQILDLLKVQELNTYLKEVRSSSQTLYELPPETEILKKYGELQTSAIELGDKLAKLRQIPEKSRTPEQLKEIDRLVKLQEDLNQQFNQFLDRPDIQKLLAALSPKVLRQTVDPTRFDALRDKLQTLNAVLIYPLILDDRLELIITTPNSPPLRRTVNVKREDLNLAIAQFRSTLKDPLQDPTPIAKKLYNWLIKPLEADLNATNPKTLIYAPDSNLRYIPIAALHDGTQYLTQRYAINHITAESLTDLTAKPSAQPKILAGAIGNQNALVTIGKTSFPFGGLPYTTREIDSIQTLNPTTINLTGDNFSLPQVKPLLGNHNILHLATHAQLVSTAENSFILFGSNTYATLNDIKTWSLSNFDLVVLSACETGLGGNFGSGGEEILGLGYQFQSRGAKATIASLWKVDDGGTQRLMTAFYSALNQGHSKTQALKLAQTALITNNFESVGLKRSEILLPTSTTSQPPQTRPNPTTTHPNYWAPFILIGNGL